MNLSTGCLLARRTGVTLHATCRQLNFWKRRAERSYSKFTFSNFQPASVPQQLACTSKTITAIRGKTERPASQLVAG